MEDLQARFRQLLPPDMSVRTIFTLNGGEMVDYGRVVVSPSSGARVTVLVNLKKLLVIVEPRPTHKETYETLPPRSRSRCKTLEQCVSRVLRTLARYAL
jgi:hypothetical protein